MEITFVENGVEKNEVDQNAMGGTELMKYGLVERIDPELMDYFQIIPSRVRELKDDKIKVLWLHDLPMDPESQHLKDGGWKKFDKLVYVSDWQKDLYQNILQIPPSKGIVLKNAIVPIPEHAKPNPAEEIRLIYHTTPHRGLELLVPVFESLCTVYDNIHLDVFSSFEAYGWRERDKPYEELFERCRAHPKITYHGFQSNDTVREHLKQAHIFAYPSIWLETSCIAMMEAMSAGLLCVHPNLGALPETTANWTYQYSFNEDPQLHANIFGANLTEAIEIFQTQDRYELVSRRLQMQKQYADTFFSWDTRKIQWTHLLGALKDGRNEEEDVAGPEESSDRETS
jgi:UDP-glucose:(glucosyl)LPS alpha-1,2-glucosyltransferase